MIPRVMVHGYPLPRKLVLEPVTDAGEIDSGGLVSALIDVATSLDQQQWQELRFWAGRALDFDLDEGEQDQARGEVESLLRDAIPRDEDLPSLAVEVPVEDWPETVRRANAALDASVTPLARRAS